MTHRNQQSARRASRPVRAAASCLFAIAAVAGASLAASGTGTSGGGQTGTAATHDTTPDSDHGRTNTSDRTDASRSDTGGVPGTARPDMRVVPFIDIMNPPEPRCAGDNGCLRRHYAALAWTYGELPALRAVERDQENGVLNPGSCHDAAHSVGEVAAQRHNATRDALASGSEMCGSGYFHGIVAWEATVLDADVLIEEMTSTCAVGEPGSFTRWECFHGVGHGFSFVSGGQILPTLDRCLLIELEVDQNPCVSGALMQEVIDRGDAVEYGDDPYQLCPSVPDGLLRSTCYDMLATIVWNRFDTTKRFEWCDRAGETYRDDCARGLGRNVDAGMPLDAFRTETFCSLASGPAMRDWCVEGAASNTFAYYGNIEDAVAHCDGFTQRDLYDVCVAAIGANGTGSTNSSRSDDTSTAPGDAGTGS